MRICTITLFSTINIIVSNTTSRSFRGSLLGVQSISLVENFFHCLHEKNSFAMNDNTENQNTADDNHSNVKNNIIPKSRQQRSNNGQRNKRRKTSSSSSSPSSSGAVHPKKRPIIFCDMDGVLVDFNSGIMKVSGKPADEMELNEIWDIVEKETHFFEFLDWTPDGRELWEAIRSFRPTLLTGVPNRRTGTIGSQKAKWCRREFQCKINHIDKAAHKPQRHAIVHKGSYFKRGMVNVISCWTKFKHYECTRPGSILIDDRIKTKDEWEKAGGIFVHHTSTQQTLAELRRLGVLQEDTKTNNNDDDDDSNNNNSDNNNQMDLGNLEESLVEIIDEEVE